MKKNILILFLLIAPNLSSAAIRVISAHFANSQVFVEVEDTQTKERMRFSSNTIGIANTTFGCTGTNCIATNLYEKNNSIYGNVNVLFEPEPSKRNVFITYLKNQNSISPGELGLINNRGKWLIVLYVNY